MTSRRAVDATAAGAGSASAGAASATTSTSAEHDGCTDERGGQRCSASALRNTDVGTARVLMLADLDWRARADMEAALAAMSVAAGQERFTLAPARALQACQLEPVRHPFAIIVGTEPVVPVGMGVLHECGADELAGTRWGRHVLLRSLSVRRESQGLGIGHHVMAALPALVDSQYSDVEWLALRVHRHNAAATRLYVRHGFAVVNVPAKTSPAELVMVRPVAAP